MAKTPPFPKRFANLAAFGRFLWGHGEQGALTRLANITLAELDENDINREFASQWREFYLQARACGDGGKTAPIRVQLLTKCLELLESKSGK